MLTGLIFIPENKFSKSTSGKWADRHRPVGEMDDAHSELGRHHRPTHGVFPGSSGGTFIG